MLVTFSCKAHANITMFGDVANKLLLLMGHSGVVPSAMTKDEVPAALERLQKAIQKQPSDQLPDDAQGLPNVSLAHRALPLIELLQDAVNDQCNVMWK